MTLEILTGTKHKAVECDAKEAPGGEIQCEILLSEW